MKFKNLRTLYSGGNLIAVVIFLIAVAIFSLLAHEVVLENEDWFDTKVFTFFKSHLDPGFISTFKFITFFGSSWFLFPAYTLVIIVLYYKKKKTKAFAIASLAITSTLLTYFLKFAFARHRPEQPVFEVVHDFSFPSGHSLSAVVFFGVLTWLTWNTGRNIIWKFLYLLLFTFFVVLIAMSRIVLRYHYASDVAAGVSMGVAYVILFFYVWSSFRKGAEE